ncbi:hypothetical protein SAMN06265365_10728 [Tistlia consotensis]|uniref:Uncharacterized protein n=1 Tax=Tistlia consotensis USBA 355 TaxID=560819 RepID=A0A1Y6B7D7_9PROT|nr:hypothetical protein [Tistlia consotensis]SME96868.1 hypothetical protein SAMN05428998_10228 [Tistlia consotensis USBA 355]SNR56254.1 hypothetical protein SAMN06265365_10728 [Tistlia consotensis]
MTREEFEDCLDSYGADLASWPVDARRAGLRLVEEDPAAARSLADARRLEALLCETPEPLDEAGAIAAILAAGPGRTAPSPVPSPVPSPAPSGVGWRALAGTVRSTLQRALLVRPMGLAAVCLALGIIVTLSLPDALPPLLGRDRAVEQPGLAPAVEFSAYVLLH